MKLAKWGCFSASVVLLAVFLWLRAPPTPATITQATLTIDGSPQGVQTVQLPHRLEPTSSGRSGSAEYRFELGSARSSGLHWLYFPRVGNQVEIRLGNELLFEGGQLGDPGEDMSKSPILLPLPNSMFKAAKSTQVVVRITVQGGRWGGLGSPVYGMRSEVYPVYLLHNVWRQIGAMAVPVAMALMALVAAGLWWMQRESVYGVFALAALFGAIRNSDRMISMPPLPWPLWGVAMALALALHVLLLSRFAIQLVGADRVSVRRVFWLFVMLELALANWSFYFQQPVVWTLALGLLVVPSLGALAVVAHAAWTRRSREATVVGIASVIVVVAGIRDFLVFRVFEKGLDSISVMPHASMVFVLLVGWVVVDRYARHARAHRELLASLDARLAQRERELDASNARLREEYANQATLLERQRIMRDIHDGVGARLVGLLGMLDHDKTARSALQEHASAALDELRMAVDASQPVHGDFATVLATLRYRLQPRLEEAGIEVAWQVDALPHMVGLTPHVVLQLQRILLEAFTNVLRHAHASRLLVQAQCELGLAPTLTLVVEDNGIGFDDVACTARAGQGLASMRARAAAIGAKFMIGAGQTGGTRVQLVMRSDLGAA